MIARTQYAKTVKAGKELWFRVSMQQCRYFRVSAYAAKLAIATGTGVEVDYMPFGRTDLILAAMESRRQFTEMVVPGLVQ
tara:strand:- start:2735 stop:2974 length:240 start_codon:yes stop_codon:yes gene_type:complete